MNEILPGEAVERLKDLRKMNGYSQKEVADRIGVNKTTYSRIENGTTHSVSNSILMGLAELYDVTTDFIMGINDVPDKTYYELSRLGLSVEAARNLYEKKANTEVVSELLANETFCGLTKLISQYLNGETAAKARMYNSMLDFSYQALMEQVKLGDIPLDEDMSSCAMGLKALKHPLGLYENEKIKSTFSKSVKEIRETYDPKDKPDQPTFNREALDSLKAEIMEKAKGKNLSEEEKISVNTEAFTNYIKNMFKLNTDMYPEAAAKLTTGLMLISDVVINYGKDAAE